MPVTGSDIGRRQSIPILYTKGTHYEVGFDVGRTFGSLIQSFVNSSEALNQEYLPAYNTTEGKEAYEATLNNLIRNFPQYIKELEGIADGAKVPFYKLLLLHIDDVILKPQNKEGLKQPTGCSSIALNLKDHAILGHTEDALSDTLNHFYFVSAHIISDKPQGRWNVKEEKFTSLCYAGHLPGYTMNYNHHGLVFSINTISATNLQPGKTPRHFLTRAMLGAENFLQVQQILRDSGVGAADACSVNLTFLQQDGDRVFHNIEVGPAVNSSESQLSALTISPGEDFIHTNEYQRLPLDQANEMMLLSSKCRSETLKNYHPPSSFEDVVKMLGDTSHPEQKVFRDQPNDYVKTIAVGIFDCNNKTWSLYSDNPIYNEPLVVLPLLLKNPKSN
ncbi:uncharacterized protein LOC123310085 [Coccinella septempunctata]|uniref:uncharacterized protein LOC123310085 n=1 Tax=Coccinella septempunctata TaxID=41139 RepID=UPI001D05FC1E|nr:uncharacterized protein LOC123310085 [Coccinella septempunctata]